MPRFFTRNAHRSVISSIRLLVGFPPPWPARVSMRIRTGLSQAWAACRAAANLKLWPGTTRSSVSAVVIERRRITHARLDVVIWRILQDGLELGRVVGRAVVVDPRSALGELLEPQHVHHAHRGQAGAEQFRPLGHHGADQQPAVAAAVDGQLVGPGVFVGDQPLGGGDEVVEDVLLLRASCRPCARPRRIRRRRGGWAGRKRRPSRATPAARPRSPAAPRC